MAGESGSGKVQTFATIVTTLLAVAAFIQSLSNRQQGASTQTASRKSYGAVGGQIEQLGQASEQQSAAIEKLWEAVSNIQGHQPAPTPAAPAPTASAEPPAAPHVRKPHAVPAASTPTPSPATTPTKTPKPDAKALGELRLQHFVEKKLPSYDDLEK